MRTALFSSTLVVNYRALTLQGIFCGGSNIGIYNWSMHEYLPTIWAMYNSEHRRYDTYLSFRILVNSTCEMKMFCFST